MVKKQKPDVFLDTNFVISDDGTSDGRLSAYDFKDKSVYITEPVERETKHLISIGKQRVFNVQHKTLTFEDLFNLYPMTCPLYYKYIADAANPAVVWSETLWLEMITYLKRGDPDRYSGLFDEIRKSHVKYMDIEDEEIKKHIPSPTDWQKKLKTLKRKHFKKKKKDAFSNKNFLNDARTISLIQLHSFFNKKDVDILTADSDFLQLMFNWISANVQEIVFKYMILDKLSRQDLVDLQLRNKKLTIYIDFEEASTHYKRYLESIFRTNRVKGDIRTNIKFWDVTEQKFYSFDFYFNESIRQLFMASHGNCHCPFTKNDFMGAWIGYIFWPPLPGEKTIKLRVKKKAIIHRYTKVSVKVHEQICVYAKYERSNNPNHFVGFVKLRYFDWLISEIMFFLRSLKLRFIDKFMYK